MTDPTMALMELMRNFNLEMDGDLLREAMQLLMQQLIELEASEQIGAGRYERTASWLPSVDDVMLEAERHIRIYTT